MKPHADSGGQSELIDLKIYSTPAGSWIEDRDTSFRVLSGEESRTGLPAFTPGPVKTRGARKGGRRGAAVQWEIEETTEATELLIFIAPSADLQQVRYRGPDGRSTFRREAETGLIKQQLAEGENEIEIRRRDGSKVVFRAKVKRLADGMEAAGKEKETLDAAEEAVREYGSFRKANKNATHIPAYHGIITLGELKPALAEAEGIGSTLLPGTTTLIQGDSGTGKELLALLIYSKWVEALNQVSFKDIRREDVPFVVAHSPTLGGDKNIQLSRLFGCAPGFPNVGDPGAPGYFLQAGGYKWVSAADGKKRQIKLEKVKEEGVLFMDEIGDLHLDTQAFLLRTIQNGVVEPLGWEPVPASPKVLLATNKDTSDLRVFRPDLRKRIDYFLSLPPLRRRARVIPHLVYFFTEQCYERRQEYLNQRKEIFDRKDKYYRRREQEYREAENLMPTSRLPRETDGKYLESKSKFFEEMESFRRRQQQFTALLNSFVKERPAALEWDFEALAALTAYSWPGNIREVAKVVERVLFSPTQGPHTHISLDRLPGYIQRNYKDLKEAVSQENQGAIEVIRNLAKELLEEAWKDLPAELLKQDGKEIPVESKKEIETRWANIIVQKLASLKDWLKQSQHFDVDALPDAKPDCMTYLVGWLDAAMKEKDPKLHGPKRAQKAQANAKQILVRVKGGLTGVPMSSAAEKRLKYAWVNGHYAVLSRFFGITIRALNE